MIFKHTKSITRLELNQYKHLIDESKLIERLKEQASVELGKYMGERILFTQATEEDTVYIKTELVVFDLREWRTSFEILRRYVPSDVLDSMMQGLDRKGFIEK